MSISEALKILEELDDKTFNDWLNTLPYRVRLCIKMTDWREILPKWWIKTHSKEPIKETTINNLPL